MWTSAVAAALVAGALAAPGSLIERNDAVEMETFQNPVGRVPGRMWAPRIGEKVQMILERRIVVDEYGPLVPNDVYIYDIDLFDTPKETIDILHRKGAKVICYLSVGGSETWRPDYKNSGLRQSDYGDSMPKWPGEHYLDIRSPTVWEFMRKRIYYAYQKGCDAIDPDNVDVFNDDFDRGGGFTPKVTPADSIVFIKKLSAEAQRYGMSMGLKNAEQLIPEALPYIQFAVNEECTTYEQGCKQYEPMIAAGKPVIHVEYAKVRKDSRRPTLSSTYPNMTRFGDQQVRDYYCTRNAFGNQDFVSYNTGYYFSTLIKSLDLGGWVMYCDDTFAETPSIEVPDRGSSGSSARSGRGGSSSSDDGDAPQPAASNPWSLSSIFGGFGSR